MHEYEFRLVVQHPFSFTPFFQSLGYSTKKQIVYYAKPHFRFKNETWEIKRIESIKAVYHDKVWFKWVHSIETPYKLWNISTCKTFLHNLGNFQDPFKVEVRDFVQIDSNAQLYSFYTGESYKLVFEWEYGTFDKPISEFKNIEVLNKYKHIYNVMKSYPKPLYQLKENVTRKPVTCVSEIMDGKQYLYAHKLDGIFGLVYSYKDKIKEKWEGFQCVIHNNITLGDGFVFAAEKMENGQVFLLDVFQVQGHDTSIWCRRSILTEFLPNLKLIKNYSVQTYVSDKNALGLSSLKTDGIIIHDVEQDVVFKFKVNHSIDLIYFKGYFHLPNGRIKWFNNDLEDGCVYEISTSTGQIIKKRPDRFKGNSAAQLETIFAYGWNGPKIEYVK